MTDRDGAAYSFADGHAGDGVSAVTLILDDGTNVQATVANGWFVAWWPSAHDVKSADVTDPGRHYHAAGRLGPRRSVRLGAVRRSRVQRDARLRYR